MNTYLFINDGTQDLVDVIHADDLGEALERASISRLEAEGVQISCKTVYSHISEETARQLIA